MAKCARLFDWSGEIESKLGTSIYPKGPKRTQKNPKGPKRHSKGPKRHPKGKQKDPKGTQKDPKGITGNDFIKILYLFR